MDLFDHAVDRDLNRRPLADALRPTSLDDFFGQEHVVGPESFFRRTVDSDRLVSMILWGPPGVGKTTLAHLVAHLTRRHFVSFSAVLGGVKDLREHIEKARTLQRHHGQRTVLFIDEIHRFNKAQQDALLPHVENGTITLIGATTENPSFQVNRALLSRARVVVLNALEPEAIHQMLNRAWNSQIRIRRWPNAFIEDGVLATLAQSVDGDGRRALNALEAALNDGRPITMHVLDAILDGPSLVHDRDGDGHFQVVSALIKSMRATDPDASAYWLMRMVDAGEDPVFIARRLVIFASEDIGHADPNALTVALNAMNAVRLIGLPEGVYALMQATTYLATAPKSNTILRTMTAARKLIAERGSLAVPKHLRNATTSLSKGQHDGQGYDYPHDFPGAYTGQSGMPAGLEDRVLFEPRSLGQEQQFIERLSRLRSQRSSD